jgi:hypothetical protein
MSLPKLYQVQTDLPLANGKFYGLPKHLPGRVNTDDFVFFNIPSEINPSDYEVVIESLDTSQHTHLRKIGTLMANVEIPFVHLDAYASIYVMPKVDPTKHTFYARLSRGSTYTIPVVQGLHRPGIKHEMKRGGVLLSGADSSNYAY